MWEAGAGVYLSSSQFCYEPKTAPKNKFFKKKKKKKVLLIVELQNATAGRESTPTLLVYI